MDITIKINCDSAAFHDYDHANHGPEVARILRKLATKIAVKEDLSRTALTLLDLNGNKVGTMEAMS